MEESSSPISAWFLYILQLRCVLSIEVGSYQLVLKSDQEQWLKHGVFGEIWNLPDQWLLLELLFNDPLILNLHCLVFVRYLSSEFLIESSSQVARKSVISGFLIPSSLSYLPFLKPHLSSPFLLEALCSQCSPSVPSSNPLHPVSPV